MKQILQNVRDGRTRVAEVPEPLARPGQVLVANRASLLSAGTEKMVLELTKKSLLGKAKERPDQVRRVLEKMRNEGLFNTLQQVNAKLDEPMTMGYCSSGLVLACGKGVESFKPGDRVASNGPHAGVVSVPKNLCARVPENVSFEQASFTVLGAIALQGVRLSKLQLGETALVIGLGLVGQLAVQILRAAGIHVIGTDPDEGRCRMALEFGAQVARPGISPRDVEEWTGGLGADAVLLTASTKSNGPMELAANAVRKKGRIVLVGVVGLELDRRPFYFKESEFVVSCSYGPGRYDPSYEEAGKDYPASYVRWTEQRNLSAVLQLMAQGRLNVEKLITHR
ncbi:MAG TPA: zinc-binding alcohol dehydrogenase, partial [bacterium]|nr:zinc-binding alcohol dehydrogenase [bacterium]